MFRDKDRERAYCDRVWAPLEILAGDAKGKERRDDSSLSPPLLLLKSEVYRVSQGHLSSRLGCPSPPVALAEDPVTMRLQDNEEELHLT